MLAFTAVDASPGISQPPILRDDVVNVGAGTAEQAGADETGLGIGAAGVVGGASVFAAPFLRGAYGADALGGPFPFRTAVLMAGPSVANAAPVCFERPAYPLLPPDSTSFLRVKVVAAKPKRTKVPVLLGVPEGRALVSRGRRRPRSAC